MPVGAMIFLGQHRTIWQAHSAKDFASYERDKRAGILYVFPPFIPARMGRKIGRRPQTQLCGDALGVVLTVFALLDMFMLISLLRPGDERNQIIVWKASSFTLLAMVGTTILNVIYNFVKAQPMTLNPFVQLEVAAIIYFVSLLVYKRKHGG